MIYCSNDEIISLHDVGALLTDRSYFNEAIIRWVNGLIHFFFAKYFSSLTEPRKDKH